VDNYWWWKVFVVIATLGIGVTVNLVPTMEFREVDCVEDKVQALLKPLNVWLANNEQTRHLLLALLTMTCDGIFVFMIEEWTRSSKSWRLPIAVVTMLICKALCSVSDSQIAVIGHV
jgi:hypothetical protein